MEVTLIKHGKTQFNELGKRQGVTDLPLSERGRAEVIALASELQFPDQSIIFTSPLKRAVETAEILFPRKNCIKNDLLSEYDFGELEGVRFSEPLDHFPEHAIETYNNKQFLIPREGESFEHITHRVRRFIALLQQGLDVDTQVFVVTHSTVIEIFKALAEGKDWCTYLGELKYEHGYITCTI